MLERSVFYNIYLVSPNNFTPRPDTSPWSTPVISATPLLPADAAADAVADAPAEGNPLAVAGLPMSKLFMRDDPGRRGSVADRIGLPARSGRRSPCPSSA